ncbi:hypothetical protein [Streptomyces sp. LUP47B]|uniref:hypothetical protein n=1 Tax=Streptomyces sp. LUP47B TaxID=1890286 RepID=UPI000AA82CBC|nr:hypothetical protein [Streptomyces sp. LUP47B]
MVHVIRTRYARDLRWVDCMAESHGEEFPRALTDPLAFAGRLAADIRRDPAQLLVSPRDGFTDSDRRTVSDPAAGQMPPRTYREALRGASYSRLDDDLALLSDWGFATAAAVRPVLLRHSPASTRQPSSSPYCCGTARLRPGDPRPAPTAAAQPGFDPATLVRPLLLRRGARDRFSPVGHFT